jgi:hypothetical protein
VLFCFAALYGDPIASLARKSTCAQAHLWQVLNSANFSIKVLRDERNPKHGMLSPFHRYLPVLRHGTLHQRQE